MARHRSRQPDATDAFIKNERQQKLLEAELRDIEQLWYAALRHITGEKLDITADWVKLMAAKRQVDYFDKDMHIDELKRYTEVMLTQMKGIQNELKRNKFNFDTMKVKKKKKDKLLSVQSTAVNLPPLQRHLSMQSLRSSRIHGRATKSSTVSIISSTRSRHREDLPSSPLKESRVKSISDSNLHDNSKYKDRSFSKNIHVDSSARLCLPSINTKTDFIKGDELRYLKHRMATVILPPVSERGKRDRKLSI